MTASPSGTAVEAVRLTKAFGERRALDGLSLSVPEGAFLSVFGPNGAGKTTLLRVLATLSRPTSGSLSVLGADALEEPEAVRPLIGLISHKPMVYGDLSARENLEFFARLYGVADPGARAIELLRLVELDHRRNDAARTLSRGMTQRLSIARALVNDPRLLLLDEPYSGLDPHAAGVLDSLIERVRPGRTLIMVSHDPEKGLALCTHALVMAKGKVVALEAKEGAGEARIRSAIAGAVGTGAA